MAVNVKLDRNERKESEDFVLIVSATTASGDRLPDKHISVSKSAVAEGDTTLEAERDRAITAAQRRISNYEAAIVALRDFQ